MFRAIYLTAVNLALLHSMDVGVILHRSLVMSGYCTLRPKCGKWPLKRSPF